LFGNSRGRLDRFPNKNGLLIINGGTYPTQAIMGVTKQPLAEGEVDAPREEHIGIE
jgi:hypothetical protein